MCWGLNFQQLRINPKMVKNFSWGELIISIWKVEYMLNEQVLFCILFTLLVLKVFIFQVVLTEKSDIFPLLLVCLFIFVTFLGSMFERNGIIFLFYINVFISSFNFENLTTFLGAVPQWTLETTLWLDSTIEGFFIIKLPFSYQRFKGIVLSSQF